LDELEREDFTRLKLVQGKKEEEQLKLKRIKEEEQKRLKMIYDEEQLKLKKEKEEKDNVSAEREKEGQRKIEEE